MFQRFRVVVVGVIVFIIPLGPTPVPAPGGIGLGGPCGSTTVAPTNPPPHSEQGRVSK